MIFTYVSPVTLTFDPVDPKNTRDPLLTETNHPMKCEDSVSNGSPVVMRKQFLHFGFRPKSNLAEILWSYTVCTKIIMIEQK